MEGAVRIVTGEVGLGGKGEAIVDSVVARWGDPSAAVFGGAHGVDSYALKCAISRYGCPIKVCYPVAWWNADFHLHLARIFPEQVELLGGPEGSSDSRSYMLRNDLMIATGVRLAAEHGVEAVVDAFPRTEERIARSGTWATVRRAEAAGITVLVHPLT